MPPHKMGQNSHKVLNSIPESVLATEVKILELERDKLPMERALGSHWCKESDTFQFKITIKDSSHQTLAQSMAP